MPNQIKNSNNIENFKMKSDDFRKKYKKGIKEGNIFLNNSINYFTEFDFYIDIIFYSICCVQIWFSAFEIDVRR